MSSGLFLWFSSVEWSLYFYFLHFYKNWCACCGSHAHRHKAAPSPALSAEGETLHHGRSSEVKLNRRKQPRGHRPPRCVCFSACFRALIRVKPAQLPGHLQLHVRQALIQLAALFLPETGTENVLEACCTGIKMLNERLPSDEWWNSTLGKRRSGLCSWLRSNRAAFLKVYISVANN